MLSAWNKLRKSLWFKNSSAQSSPRVLNQVGSFGSISWCLGSTSSASSSMKSCAICLNHMESGEGQAIFIAECSHSFHFTCIANNVKHGNLECPLCRFQWKEIPSELPTSSVSDDQTIPSNNPGDGGFCDDESLDGLTPSPSTFASVMVYTQYDVVAAQESIPDFSIRIRVKAPPLSVEGDRAPIDLVLVLDTSSSMTGEKLVLLKHAARFIIGNLGCDDRLSIVSFASHANRILPLCRMNSRGKDCAEGIIHSLCVSSGTNIVEGLVLGERVLVERRDRNLVASIILISDGRDTNHSDLAYPNPLLNQLATSHVHTVGLGCDHDPSMMHAISDASGGTYNFIESASMVQNAFERCIAGHLTLVAREFRLMAASTSLGVTIGSVHSASYVSAITVQDLECAITVGDLFANEEKEFTLFVSVPVCRPGVEKTQLVYITCCYKDARETTIDLGAGGGVEVLRQSILSSVDHIVSVEVDRLRSRLSVVESIIEAQRIAETGNFEGAKLLLLNQRILLLNSASAQDENGLCDWLEAKLREIENIEMYGRMGALNFIRNE